METRVIQLNNLRERREIESFLLSQGLAMEEDIEYTVALYEDNRIIGTGSIAGRVLKSIAVDSNYQGEGLSNKIVSLLVNEQYYRGNTHLFIYTKPENRNMFGDMGFVEIYTVDGQVSLLENNINGINGYVNSLKTYKRDGKIISSIVMNCNPFTLGHQYLIEKASKESDFVHIFIVWEDRSIFPSEIRFNLVKEGTKHLQNVIVHKGKDYIISNSTFPSYFLKEKSNIVEIHALLDLGIFGEYIASTLEINRRYVGEEPYCLVTRKYNETMKDTLPKYGIEVVEVPRLKDGDVPISASKVREYIKNGKLEEMRNLIPITTYDFLISDKGKVIIDRIRMSDSRH